MRCLVNELLNRELEEYEAVSVYVAAGGDFVPGYRSGNTRSVRIYYNFWLY